MQYFDIIAECANPIENEADHTLRIAFGPKRNQGKALLKWTPEKREFGKMTIEPHPVCGTWYGRGRIRDYVGQLCSKADRQKEVYINIVGARK